MYMLMMHGYHIDVVEDVTINKDKTTISNDIPGQLDHSLQRIVLWMISYPSVRIHDSLKILILCFVYLRRTLLIVIFCWFWLTWPHIVLPPSDVLMTISITLDETPMSLVVLKGQDPEDAVAIFCQKHIPDDLSGCIRQLLPDVLDRLQES